jgi:hypothetical protein
MIASSLSSEVPRRQVSIRRDGEEFVVAFQPENVIIFRHHDASALRRVCLGLRWKILSDTAEEDYLRALVTGSASRSRLGVD